jgi:CMP-N-acetylneuraminic acid synthetase
MNVAIITAKGSNESIKNKNLLPIMGIPAFLYPVKAAQQACNIDEVYVSTEDKEIKRVCLSEGISVIDRPEELSTPTSQHKDVIKHAVSWLPYEKLDLVTVLLGNTVHLTPKLINESIDMIGEDCDSVVSAWKAQDDHPYRALNIQDGYVKSFLNKKVSSNRQSYPDVYYYDQGVWTFKKDCALNQKGPPPWVWLGKKCKILERSWVTGRDIHSWIDISASIWYLNSLQTSEYIDFKE